MALNGRDMPTEAPFGIPSPALACMSHLWATAVWHAGPHPSASREHLLHTRTCFPTTDAIGSRYDGCEIETILETGLCTQLTLKRYMDERA